MEVKKESIKSNKITKSFKKRLFKRVAILISCLSVPLIVILSLYFTLGGDKSYSEMQRAKNYYDSIFVQKKQIDSKDWTEDAKEDLNNIYKLFDDKNAGTPPTYNKTTKFSFASRGGKTYYQFEQEKISKGTGKFIKWLSKVIFIFNSKHQVEEVQYKTN